MTTKKIQKVCVCENCGNEAEMELTCTMPEDFEDAPGDGNQKNVDKKVKVKGTGTCISCGNEADLWIDL